MCPGSASVILLLVMGLLWLKSAVNSKYELIKIVFKVGLIDGPVISRRHDREIQHQSILVIVHVVCIVYTFIYKILKFYLHACIFLEVISLHCHVILLRK